MADLTQTAANVRSGSNGAVELVQAGEAGITAGTPVYQKTADEKYYKADADAGSSESDVYGIALMNADADEYFVVQTEGDINVGATTVTGEVYVLSSTAGKIAPASDIASGWYPSILGTAKDTSGTIDLDISNGSTPKA